MTENRDATTYWVCVDCYEVHHGVREDHREPPDREPLNRIPEDAEVTAGLLFENHDDDCPNRKAQDWVVDCDCERMTFSWWSCDGCGSTLGGAREALTVWTKKETP